MPILAWLPRYDFKNHFIWDLIAGLTVSVLQIPHGLAFAPLGGQAPVVGLYMAIFPIVIYVVFGTSRHISLGMQAILIMMVGKIVETYSGSNSFAHNTTTNGYSALQVGIACTFTIGLWELILGVLQLGCLCVLLSNSLVSGLTSGAAIHIIFLQLKHIFGIPISMVTGPLKLIYLSIDFCRKITQINLVSFGMSFTFMLILFIFNEYLKPILSTRSRIPIPVEFILIGIGIVLSECLDLEGNYGVWVVGTVPSGLPEIVVPPFSLIPAIAVDCLIIALVNVSINISLAKVFAKKGGYSVRENQELFAYGFSNIFGGFLQCLPVCAALSRSMVQFSVGGITEMAHVVCLISVLFMLLFLGPVFEKVPLCVLAAIVVVTVKALFMQVTELPGLWRANKFDGIVWLVTFVSVVVVDIDYGIAMGLVASVLTLGLNSTQVQVQVLGRIQNPTRFVDLKCYKEAQTFPNLIIFKIIGGVNFVNSMKITRKIQQNLDVFWAQRNDNSASFAVVTFCSVPYVDSCFVNNLTTLAASMEANNCQMIMTDCSTNIHKTFEDSGFFTKFPKEFVMISLNAAVQYLHDVNRTSLL